MPPSSLFRSPASRAALLLRKELRLQRPTLLLAAAGIGAQLALLAVLGVASDARAGGYRLADLLGAWGAANGIFLTVGFPIFAGICATIPERRSGVLDWQASLPVSRRAQWAAKCLVACALTLGFDLVFGPLSAFVGIPWHVQDRMWKHPAPVLAGAGGILAASLALTLASAWIGTLFKEALTTLAAILGFVLLVGMWYVFLDPTFLALPLAIPRGLHDWRHVAATLLLVGGAWAGLFALGVTGWRFAPVSRRGALARVAAWFVFQAALVLLTIHVRHDFDPLVGLEPVPAKGLVPLLGSRPDWRPGPRPTTADGPWFPSTVVGPFHPFTGPVFRVSGSDGRANGILATFAVEEGYRRLSHRGRELSYGQVVQADVRTGAIRFTPGRIGQVLEIDPDGASYILESTPGRGYRYGAIRFPFHLETSLGRTWDRHARESWWRADHSNGTRSSFPGGLPSEGVFDHSGVLLDPGNAGTSVRLAVDSRMVVFRSARSASAGKAPTHPLFLARREDPGAALSGKIVALDHLEEFPYGDSDSIARLHPWLTTSDDRWFMRWTLAPPGYAIGPWKREPAVLREAEGDRTIDLDVGPTGWRPAIAGVPLDVIRGEPGGRLGGDPRVIPVSPDGRWLVLAYVRASARRVPVPQILRHPEFFRRLHASNHPKAILWCRGGETSVRWELRALDLETGEFHPLRRTEEWKLSRLEIDSWHAWREALQQWGIDDRSLRSVWIGGAENRPPMAWSPQGTLAVLIQDRLYLFRLPDGDRRGAPPELVAEIPLEETQSDDLAFLDDDTLLLMGRFSIWRMDVKAALEGAGMQVGAESRRG